MTARGTNDRNFALPRPGKAATVFAWTLGAGVPAVIAVALGLQARSGAIEPIAALMSQAMVALLIVVVLLPLFRRRIAFDGRRLRVEATWYTRESPVSDFRLDEARVVDLRERTEFRPGVKTNGVGLPGFLAGHFRMRDWKRKAFCLVTDPARVLVLPHADGSTWLLSFEHPQAVLDILRRA
jgi:hypothetical protein